jgi:hypothetical protein
VEELGADPVGDGRDDLAAVAGRVDVDAQRRLPAGQSTTAAIAPATSAETTWPARASAVAVSAPNPLEAPVTRTILRTAIR